MQLLLWNRIDHEKEVRGMVIMGAIVVAIGVAMIITGLKK